jgi:hypothetical protein
MPSQTKPVCPTPARQSLNKHHDDLTHIGSWDTTAIYVGHETNIELDLLSSSSNGTQRSPHTVDSNHPEGTAHSTLNQQSHQTHDVNLNYFAGNSTSHRVSGATLSNCQNGPSQLELWTQEFQRLESLAYRLARE